MKICHIITRLATGGAQEMVLDIASYLDEHGVEVEILTGMSSDKSKSGNNNRLYQNVLERNIKTTIIPHLSNDISIYKDFYVIFWLARYMKKNKNTIFHIHSSKVGILARIAGYLAGNKKVIFHVHGWSFSRYSGIKAYILRYIECILSYLSCYIIFVCQTDLEDFGFINKSNSKFKVIYPCISDDFLRKSSANIVECKSEAKKRVGYDSGKLLIGTIGRLDEQKNPIDFANITNELKKLNINSNFVWVGDGTLEGEFRKKIKELNLIETINVPGFIENVDNYYQAIDIFLITSRYEGLPVSALKAIVCNACVVGYNVNGMGDLNKIFTTVYCSDQKNIRSIVEVIVKLIRNEGLNYNELEKNRNIAISLMARSKMMSDLMSTYLEID